MSFGLSSKNNSIPFEIGNLTKLTSLNLYRNELSGEIPIELGNLVNLIHLYLHDNSFTGLLPESIENLTNLTSLDISSNNLSGQIPNSICNQGDTTPQLEYNSFCPPYPLCLSDNSIGEQDSSDCECLDEFFGDLNYDSIVNIEDILILLNCVLENINCNICFDIDDNGMVNISDIIVLLNIILNTAGVLSLVAFNVVSLTGSSGANTYSNVSFSVTANTDREINRADNITKENKVIVKNKD